MQLQNCINYLLTVAQHEVHQNISEKLSQFNITPGQYGVLNCLWQYGSCTPREIAQTLRLENSTISGVLDRMQKRGLIDRVVDPNDRRSVRVITTEEGSSLREDVLRAVDELNAEIGGVYDPEQWNNFLEMLREIGKIELPKDN
ncbi:MAG: MarR family transcriptional regulator [Clostridiales bacterium]|nr:MarR family transcriptional regulator [Clostridiales bacterium]